MSKQGPTSELDHDNWDDKYIPEEAKMFTRESEDTIQKRVICTAKHTKSQAKPSASEQVTVITNN